MAYVVMAHVVMAHVVMAYVVEISFEHVLYTGGCRTDEANPCVDMCLDVVPMCRQVYRPSACVQTCA